MSKFKVGDKVIACNYDKYPKKKHHGIIKSVDYSDNSPYYLGSCIGYWSEKYLTLDSRQPLTNTIITNITSPEQHKRVQEKLLSLGNTQYGDNVKVNSIKVYGDPNYRFASFNYPDFAVFCECDSWPRIPASSFLGEDEDLGETVPSQFHYGKPLPYKIQANQDIEDDILNRMFGLLQNFVMPPLKTTNKFNIKKSMNNIVTFAKDLLLSADEKLLRKMGIKDECGEYTSEAEGLVSHKLIKDNEPYLLEIAKAKEVEDSKK